MKGIGAKRLEKLRSEVTVGAVPPPKVAAVGGAGAKADPRGASGSACKCRQGVAGRRSPQVGGANVHGATPVEGFPRGALPGPGSTRSIRGAFAAGCAVAPPAGERLRPQRGDPSMKRLLLAFVLLVFSSFAIAAVNINTATKDELDVLPGIGPVKAQAIVDYRKANGRSSRSTT